RKQGAGSHRTRDAGDFLEALILFLTVLLAVREDRITVRGDLDAELLVDIGGGDGVDTVDLDDHRGRVRVGVDGHGTPRIRGGIRVVLGANRVRGVGRERGARDFNRELQRNRAGDAVEVGDISNRTARLSPPLDDDRTVSRFVVEAGGELAAVA